MTTTMATAAARTIATITVAPTMTTLMISTDGGDANYVPSFEPSGEDFLSPSLCELALMSRVLPSEAFMTWAQGFLPSLLCPLSDFKKVICAERPRYHA